ncbi:hypothetical protein RHGRI_004573 [Rhododendron griersonianum]|uniref:ATP synthase F0 subunit 8 n=1 Tax=Rhododendron griersonianum TaxID=479676 RepID=A0AAV6LA48_9ERIC|nr:hypothetical protein RHGRI_004573 [Rhododendron griersonianum]
MKDLEQVNWRCLSLLILVGMMVMRSWKPQRSLIRWERKRRIINQLSIWIREKKRT